MWEVLTAAWHDPFYISSNFAREHAIPVAFAASMGWVSNLQPDGRAFSRKWHITAEGEVALRHRHTFIHQPPTQQDRDHA